MPKLTRHGPAPWLPILLEVVLALLGFWTLWGFPYRNGLLALLKAQTEPGAVIPGPVLAPMRQIYTGIEAIDNRLTVLVSFFYTAIDGNRADVTVSFLGLGGQVLASWVLITVEGHRAGNNGWWFLTATTLFGLAVAIVGFACVAPLYFALHLYFSATAVEPQPFTLLLTGSPLQITLAPFAILIGFGIPSVIMTLPAPAVLSFSTKQLWTGVQQGWPIWIAIAQVALTLAVSPWHDGAFAIPSHEIGPKTLKRLRAVYLFALSFGIGSHLVPLLFAALAHLFPLLFAPPYDAQFRPAHLLVPVNPFGLGVGVGGRSYKAATIADGALPFLQWDTVVGVISVAIWGFSLRTLARYDFSLPSSQSGSTTTKQVVADAVKFTVLASVIGPAAAAVVAVWARDELVLRG
ncbi:hypothetical protein DV738_g1794, partial [Chaetothyriales sp. CBS 135597]